MSAALATAGRRILLALDAARCDPVQLQLVADLAAHLRAEVDALFIEDDDLLRTAELAFLREINLRTATAAPIEAGALRRTLRALAADAQRALAQTVGRARVGWRFRVVRGRKRAAVAAAAGDIDLLVALTAARPLARPQCVAAAALEAAARAGRPVLLLRPGVEPLGAVVVTLAETPLSERALGFCAELAERIQRPLVIQALGADAAGARRLLAAAEARAARHRLDVRGRAEDLGATPRITAIGRIQALAAELPGALWCLPADLPLLNAPRPPCLEDLVDGAILLVR
jgi:hypothetical protein